jgi:hypothetical protein
MGSHKGVSLGDLARRTYEDKECVHFEYEIEAEEQPTMMPKVLRMVFDRSEIDHCMWHMMVVIPKGLYDSGTVYDIQVKMPTVSLSQDVTKVCLCGLYSLKAILGAQSQDMSVFQFMLSDIVSEEGLL